METDEAGRLASAEKDIFEGLLLYFFTSVFNSGENYWIQV